MSGQPSLALLFTREGREWIKAVMAGRLNLLVCERGFIDHADGIEIKDESMLRILVDGPTRLNDRAEALIEIISQSLTSGNIQEIAAHTDKINSLLSDLKKMREAGKRAVPEVRP